MSRFTRRQILQMLSMILPASVLGFRREEAQDAFDKELVCVHIFQPGFKIPEPLWEKHDSIHVPRNHSDLFTLKIPELIFCTMEKAFLSIFEYFWPIERSEFNETLRKVNIEYEKQKIEGKSDVSEFSRYLEKGYLDFSIRPIGHEITKIVLFRGKLDNKQKSDKKPFWDFIDYADIVLT